MRASLQCQGSCSRVGDCLSASLSLWTLRLLRSFPRLPQWQLQRPSKEVPRSDSRTPNSRAPIASPTQTPKPLNTPRDHATSAPPTLQANSAAPPREFHRNSGSRLKERMRPSRRQERPTCGAVNSARVVLGSRTRRRESCGCSVLKARICELLRDLRALSLHPREQLPGRRPLSRQGREARGAAAARRGEAAAAAALSARLLLTTFTLYQRQSFFLRLTLRFFLATSGASTSSETNRPRPADPSGSSSTPQLALLKLRGRCRLETTLQHRWCLRSFEAFVFTAFEFGASALFVDACSLSVVDCVWASCSLEGGAASRFDFLAGKSIVKLRLRIACTGGEESHLQF